MEVGGTAFAAAKKKSERESRLPNVRYTAEAETGMGRLTVFLLFSSFPPPAHEMLLMEVHRFGSFCWRKGVWVGCGVNTRNFPFAPTSFFFVRHVARMPVGRWVRNGLSRGTGQ